MKLPYDVSDCSYGNTCIHECGRDGVCELLMILQDIEKLPLPAVAHARGLFHCSPVPVRDAWVPGLRNSSRDF